jgi:hypothetical protein
VSALDREGDSEMKDAEVSKDGEVVTIPITIEDELADIPPEMRANVAKEISAFRERSNRRDIERMKREEEIEAMERARNSGSRINRLASPPASAPSGPAAGINGIPLGPRDRNVLNAPSGPKAFGVQIPKDYQKGVSFVNGGSLNGVSIDREGEDSDASDEEIERRRQDRLKAEQEKQFSDLERRWLSRERSRTAALEREKKREDEEDEKLQAAHDEMEARLGAWNDDIEDSRKAVDYYADRSAWLRNRASFRSREANIDEADRAAEERERVQSAKQQEQARGMADDFLARQAKELETRPQEAPREPQRFKLSLGAAAQKAQAATSRRAMADVEGLLEDEEEPATTTRRPLIPIKFDSAAEAAGLTDEERAQAARQLAAEIPAEKEGLWNWAVKWEFVDDAIISDQLKPFVEKKIVEYLGVQEQMLVDVVEEHVRKRGSPQELVEQLAEVSIYPFFFFMRRVTDLTFLSIGIGRRGRSPCSQALADDHFLFRERETRLVLVIGLHIKKRSLCLMSLSFSEIQTTCTQRNSCMYDSNLSEVILFSNRVWSSLHVDVTSHVAWGKSRSSSEYSTCVVIGGIMYFPGISNSPPIRTGLRQMTYGEGGAQDKLEMARGNIFAVYTKWDLFLFLKSFLTDISHLLLFLVRL